jgi:flagellar biosynthesis/type III secretory pathway protein FliH
MSAKPTSTQDLADAGETEEQQQEQDQQDQQDQEQTGREEGETRGSPDGRQGPLLPDDQTERFSERWAEIQTTFVDEPRQSVEQADALVADLMQRLAAGFADERGRLEAQWDKGDDVSTEDLRVALTRYRSFFERLLST